MNQVSYQPGKSDAYYHRYEYDAENRLTQVYSGRDSIMLFLFPELEASYEYYAHGPLARTILGKLNVQGLDHAYTLQRWVKGINPAMGGSLTAQDEDVDNPSIWKPTPINIVDEYIEEGNAEVNYDPRKNTTTVGEGKESDAKKGKKSSSSTNANGSGVRWNQVGSIINSWLSINPNIQVTIQ